MTHDDEIHYIYLMSFCIGYPLLSPLMDNYQVSGFIYRCFSYIYVAMCLFDVVVGLYV